MSASPATDDSFVFEGGRYRCDFFQESEDKKLDCPYFRDWNVLFITVTTKGLSQFFGFLEDRQLVMMSYRKLSDSFLIVVLNNLIIVIYLNSTADFDENEFIQFVRLLSGARWCISCDPEEDSCFNMLGNEYGIGDFLRLMLRPEIRKETDERNRRYKVVEESLKEYFSSSLDVCVIKEGTEVKVEKEKLKALVAKPLLMFVLESQIRGLYEGSGFDAEKCTLDDFIILDAPPSPQYLALHKRKFCVVSIWEQWDADAKDMMREISHPSVLKLYGEVEGKLILEPVMKWDVFEQDTCSTTPSTGDDFLLMSIYTDLVFGLEFVHRNGYVFQDFSEKDLAMGQDGRCKIARVHRCKKVCLQDNVSYELASQELRLMYMNVSVVSNVYQKYLCTNGIFKHREPVSGDNIIDLLWHAIECNILTLNPMLLQRTCELLDYQTNCSCRVYQKIVLSACESIYRRMAVSEFLKLTAIPLKVIRQGMMTRYECFCHYEQTKISASPFQEELRAIQDEVSQLYQGVPRAGSQPNLTEIEKNVVELSSKLNKKESADKKAAFRNKPPSDYLNYYHSPSQLPMRTLDSCLKALFAFLKVFNEKYRDISRNGYLSRVHKEVCQTVNLLRELRDRVDQCCKDFEALKGRAKAFLEAMTNLEVMFEEPYYPQEREDRVRLAARCFKLSADQGHAPAQFRYGLCLKEGEGVPRDLDEAARYFKLSADQGWAPAQLEYARLCKKMGQGDPRLLGEAARYFKMAADQDDEVWVEQLRR